MGRHPCREGKEECRRYRARWVLEGDTQDWGLGQKGQPQGTEQHPSAPGRLLGKPFQCHLAGEREQPQRGLGTVLTEWCSNSLARASGSGWLWWVGNFQLLGSPVRPPRRSQIRRCWLLAFSAVGGTGHQHFPFQWDSAELVHFNHIFLVLSSPFFVREAGKGTTEQSGPCQVLAP